MTLDQAPESTPFVIGVGAPAYVLLHHFGALIYRAYDTVPYLVGSATRTKTGWRDVDVRLILDDTRFDTMFGPVPEAGINAHFSLLSASISLLGEKMTGLPIDFQFQQQTWANKHYPGHRQPLGIWLSTRDDKDNVP